MNISSHGEFGDLPIEVNKRKGEGRRRRLIREKTELQEADHETTYEKTITTPNAR